MKWRVTAAWLGALVMVSAACGAEETPEQKAASKLDKALAALGGRPHRADVEVDVYASTMRIPPFKMSAEMRGTHRAMPERRATDLDLSSVKTTIDRRFGDDLVDSGKVRVITLGEKVYVRNTLQSERWRTLPQGPEITGKNGYDPASTGNMINTTVVAEMYRDRPGLSSRPSTNPAGEPMTVYSLTCRVAECLEGIPEARDTMLRVYPGDAILNSRLWVDGKSRPRRLTLKSEFLAGAAKTPLSVKFEATLTLHDLGKPQNITPPAG